MFGYHFTTSENWQKIQRWGLITSLIDDAKIRELSGSQDGIWIYNEPLEDDELLGCLIWLMGQKRTDTICELKIEFQTEDRLQPIDAAPGDCLRLIYHGQVGSGTPLQADWNYVKSKPITILRYSIPPEQVELHRHWALRQCKVMKGEYV